MPLRLSSRCPEAAEDKCMQVRGAL